MPPRFELREPAWLHEFKAFLRRGSVIDLAVGIVIGAAFTGIVNSLVEDLLNPILGVLVGGIDFSNLFVVLAGERQPSLEATRQGGAAVLAIGRFLNAAIKFLIVAMAIFWLLRMLTRIGLFAPSQPKSAEPAPPPRSETLLAEILAELRTRPPR